MLRVLILGILMMLAVGAHAENVIMIDSECVKLEDIFPGIGIDDDVYCGLDYGEDKVINRQMSLYIINKYKIAGASPGEVTFRRRGVELTSERFQEDVSNLLSVMYGEIDVEISGVRMGRAFYFSEADGYQIDIPKGRFGNVAVKVDNGIRRYNYTVSLKAFKQIYVAKGSIKKGQDIAGMVEKERYDLSRVRGEAIDDPEGYIATKNISAGRPVTQGDVMKKPDAFSGSTVLLVFDSGTLNVSTTGELQEDAYVGKNVRVKNTTSGKIVRGVYQNGRKVLVNSQ